MTRMRIVLALLLITGAACAPVAVRNAEDSAATDALVWPDPPEQARIRYLYSFYEPVDLGIKPGVLERFVRIFAGNEGRRMARPYAIAVDQDLIAVADPGLSVVHLYLTKSEKYQVITELDEASLVSPVGVALSAEAIYITDSVLGRIFVMGRDGERRLTISGLQRPTGIVYHPGSRRLFVTDTVAHRIVVFDEQGWVLNPNLSNYRILRAKEAPQEIDEILIETPQKDGPHGARGIGELVMVAVAPAIANAIFHATGVQITRLPMSPQNIWSAVQQQRPDLIEEAKNQLKQIGEV